MRGKLDESKSEDKNSQKKTIDTICRCCKKRNEFYHLSNVIIGKDREEPLFQNYLNKDFYNCRNCESTQSFYNDKEKNDTTNQLLYLRYRDY